MSKSESDDVKKIKTSFLKKYGYFKSQMSGTMTWTRGGLGSEYKSSVGIETSTLGGSGYLRIHYTQDRGTDNEKNFNYKIPLTTTPCYFGGKRYWFICPWYKNGVYCGKRVGTLYKDGNYFACRHCYDLTYSSRKINHRYKMFPLFNAFTLDQKIEELERQIKRRRYRGRLTKKQRKLENLYNQAERNYAQIEYKNML